MRDLITQKAEALAVEHEKEFKSLHGDETLISKVNKNNAISFLEKLGSYPTPFPVEKLSDELFSVLDSYYSDPDNTFENRISRLLTDSGANIKEIPMLRDKQEVLTNGLYVIIQRIGYNRFRNKWAKAILDNLD